jgi:hypothetical protein
MNPLAAAVEAHKLLDEAHTEMMHEIGGCAVLENFDQELFDEIYDLTFGASESVDALSSRAREARLNLIWKDFMKKHSRKKEGCCE